MDTAIVLEFLGFASVSWGPNASAPINTQTDYNLFASTWPAASGPVPTFAAMQSAWATIGSAAAYGLTQERTAASAFVVRTGEVQARLYRAVAQVLVNQFNIHRAQVIGVASASWTPAVMANGAGATSPSVAVAGAAFGDFVDVGCSKSLAGLTATGFVVSAGNVAVRLHNGTGASVTFGAATFNVAVRRLTALPQLQLSDGKTAIQNAANSSATD